MTVSSFLSIHNATKISASCHADLASAPLMLSFEGDDWRKGRAEITIHTENVELALAMVKAINDVAAAFPKKQAAPSFICEKCEAPTANPEDEYGEYVCDNCQQNAAEAAYERHCEAFHDGGATQFRSLLDQQIEARRLK